MMFQSPVVPSFSDSKRPTKSIPLPKYSVTPHKNEIFGSDELSNC
jgi:hypothetical protein